MRGLCAREVEQVRGEVDAGDMTLRPHGLRSRQCRRTAAAADVEYVRAGGKLQALDRRATETRPERVRRIVVVIGSRVVRRGCAFLRVVGERHDGPPKRYAREGKTLAACWQASGEALRPTARPLRDPRAASARRAAASRARNATSL